MTKVKIWLTKKLVYQGATDNTCSTMPKGFAAKIANPATHWSAKLLVDQGATDNTCSIMPKEFADNTCKTQLTLVD